jgi:hypothetical protein
MNKAKWFVKQVGKVLMCPLFLLSIFVSSAHATVAVFSEDFEEGIGLWSASNGVWEVGTPTAGPSSCYSGNMCAGTILDGNYPLTSSRLISEPIQLSKVSDNSLLSLRFWHWFSFGSSTSTIAGPTSPDWGLVQISVFDPPTGTWSDWTTISSTFVSRSGAWTLNSIDLTPYAGALAKIAFLHANNSRSTSSGWYVDKIEIISTSELVCDIQMSQDVYINGDTVTAQIGRLANPGLNPAPVIVMLWFELPGSPPVPYLTMGANGSFVLTPGFDQNFGPLPLMTVEAAFARGEYAFNCRLLHAVTGAPLAEDFNLFQLQ